MGMSVSDENQNDAATIRSTGPAFPQATASNPCRRAIHGVLGLLLLIIPILAVVKPFQG